MNDVSEANKSQTKGFESGAVRSNDDAGYRYDLICTSALARLAERYDLGSRHYGDDNWLKGLPMSNIINHLEKHLAHFKSDPSCNVDDDLGAIAWGVFALMHFQTSCECHRARAIMKDLDRCYLEAQKA